MKKRIKQFTKIALAVLGAWVLVLYTLPLFGRILNAGNIFGIALGVGIIAISILFDRIVSLAVVLWRNRIGKIIISLICIIAIGFFSIFGITYKSIVDYAQYTANDEPTVIVLGCKVDGDRPSLMLKWRCDVASKYLLDNPNAVAILSGGQGPDENMSEAECMLGLITEQGISSDRLYIEDQSTSTEENIANSKKIIEENNLSTDIAIATSDYHEKRASIIAKKNGLNASSIPAYGDKYSRTTFFTREVFGVWVQYLK